MRRRLGLVVVAVCAAVEVLAVAPAALADESVTAQLSSANPTVGHQLTIDGDVTGAATAESMITATREDATGTTAIAGTTTTQGHFQLQDTPPARGQVIYHVTADGSATTEVAVQVAGMPTDLSIHVRPAPADVQGTVRVSAHLGSPTTNRTVTLSLRPYHRSRHDFDGGPVDTDGDRSATHVVHRRTTFFASFAGDTTYAPVTVRRTVRARAVLDEALRGWFRSSNGVRIYHRDDNPALAVHMLPERKGACLYFRAQHKSHGDWVRSAVSSCVHTDSSGRAIGVLKGHHITGVAYRLRAEWHGTKAVARRSGDWMRLEFR